MIAGSLAWTAVVLTAVIALTAFYQTSFSKKWPTGKGGGISGRAQIPFAKKQKGAERLREVLAICSRNLMISGWPYVLAIAVALAIPGNLLGIVTLLLLILTILRNNCAMFALFLALAHRIGQIKLFWASTLPHGVLELPAISSILGHALWVATHRGGTDILSSLIYVGVSAALMFIAAVVEVYITPKVIEAFEH